MLRLHQSLAFHPIIAIRNICSYFMTEKLELPRSSSYTIHVTTNFMLVKFHTSFSIKKMSASGCIQYTIMPHWEELRPQMLEI
ncbi:Uncharacterized protein TCM_043790 [Theobroma cacao]|uniref:Uncharacterized protein n=1 Tax=Theobroma cacao TaxID=3641 RepID=A0A061FPU4_THECC|nr:Uncharacterized protein TCM_043790 [Theobroma cacao]